MRIDWTYAGCDEHQQQHIEQYWDQVQDTFDAKVAELSNAATELRFVVDFDDSPEQWEIQAALHLPGHTLVAESKAPDPEPAVDRLLHDLAEAIDRLEATPVATARRRRGTEKLVSSLETWRQQGRSQAFVSFLVPVLESLGSYVAHQLEIREAQGTLSGEEITASDVLDEVLVDAWNQFHQRNQQLPLDLWLVELADSVMDRLERPVAPQSIDDETPTPSRDRRASDFDEGDGQVDFNTPPTIELSELLPGEPGIDAWDELDMETKQAHLAEMLSQLPWECSQACILNLALGFTMAEIADFQDRAVADVEQDVEQAVKEVRRFLRAERAPSRKPA